METELAALTRSEVRSWRGLRILSVVVALFAVLPQAYVFNGFRDATEEARRFNAVQRAGADYLRPLTTLLATLVDAQGAAVRGVPVLQVPVREAIEQVDRLNVASGDPLGVRHRWSQLRIEIDAALGGTVSGPEAMRSYAEPIRLTQALFNRIGDASLIARDPKVDAQYLIDTAIVAVPEVIINAGEIAGLVGSDNADESRLAVALDRVSRAAQAIRVGPNSAADQVAAGPASMSLLQPLDEFTAAADALVHAASVPNLATAGFTAELDDALRRLRQAALELDGAVLDALNTVLDRRLVDINAQRRNMLIAGLLIPVTVAALLWLLWLGRGGGSGRQVPEKSEGLVAEPLARLGAGLAGVAGAAPAVRAGEAR
jgi:hypothetical protein